LQADVFTPRRRVVVLFSSRVQALPQRRLPRMKRRATIQYCPRAVRHYPLSSLCSSPSSRSSRRGGERRPLRFIKCSAWKSGSEHEASSLNAAPARKIASSSAPRGWCLLIHGNLVGLRSQPCFTNVDTFLSTKRGGALRILQGQWPVRRSAIGRPRRDDMRRSRAPGKSQS